jgi:predicted HTH transcriptional regulator
MTLFGKHLDSITEADLQALVDNEVAEDKVTEYKQELPGGGESQRKEFLYDVTAFANASGGDLIFGVKEQGSRATGLTGLRVGDESAEVQRLDSIVRAGVEPRIPGISYKFIPLSSGGSVLILRVPRSWALPHVVKLGGTFRFYSRNANGKYPLDVGELRALFALSETTSERVKNFRRERRKF